MVIVAIAIACSRRPVGIPEGNYQRAAYMATDPKGRVLSSSGDVDRFLPPSIRVLSGNVYEIDARGARIRGSYRVERDSVFFDDHAAGGQTVVALFGIQSGDTLQLHAPVVLMALGGAPDMDLLINFVRRP